MDDTNASAPFLAQFTLHSAQAAFVGCGERFSFYVGGVGAGKTMAGAVRAIARALDAPGSLGLIGAPTYPMLRDATQRTVFALLEQTREGTTEHTERGRETERAPRRKPQSAQRTHRGSERRPSARAEASPEEQLAHTEAVPLDASASLPSALDSVSSVVSVVHSLFPYAYNKSEGHLTLANGSEILFRSLDEPDRVRGLNLAWFWLDEAPLCGYYAWQILKGRLRQQSYATAGWATGTPHGRDGFARDFEIERKAHHVLYRASTLDNAANLPEDYLGDLGYSGALYDQEVLGLFTAFEGLVYRFQADTDGHIHEPGGFTTEHTGTTERLTDQRVPTEPTESTEETREDESALAPSGGATASGDTRDSADPGAGSSLSSLAPRGSVSSAEKHWKAVIGGVDWGYTNPTAAVVFALDGDGRAWQLDEWYQRRAPLDAVVLPALCDLTRRYGVRCWYGGPDEPEHIAALQAALVREGLSCRVVAANDAVRAGIQTVTRLLDRRGDATRGLSVAARCVHTIAEYLSYQYETPGPGIAWAVGARSVSPSGAEVSELPLKQNDHAMDATRYALHTALGQAQATQTYLARMRASLRRGERLDPGG